MTTNVENVSLRVTMSVRRMEDKGVWSGTKSGDASMIMGNTTMGGLGGGLNNSVVA